MSGIITWRRFCENVGQTFENAKPSKIYKYWDEVNRKRKGTNIRTTAINPIEANMPKCSIALGKFNYVILLRNYGFAIKSGIEQRDAAIKMGALGATTLLYNNNKFIMPGAYSNNKDSLQIEPTVASLLIDKLEPGDNDAIIIGSDNESLRIAEFAAKNAALFTIMNHETHRD